MKREPATERAAFGGEQDGLPAEGAEPRRPRLRHGRDEAPYSGNDDLVGRAAAIHPDVLDDDDYLD
ncbi:MULTISPECIES: hypothetical protein [Kitasatospora]|uniref:DUF5709 domain-containing protein n=2 Tax=Kitasatospora TaxID=2063 RepID=A0ABT1J8U4_9ACTN|nr:hypothetical protein [Kitasatospora paracochleata]MCP2313867.1 hypothetical protein [Kitasatospora paracochleata]